MAKQKSKYVTNIDYDSKKSTLKDMSNINSVFGISTRIVKQRTQTKLWWSIQTSTSNISNNSAQHTLSHDQESKEKSNSKNMIYRRLRQSKNEQWKTLNGKN